MMPRRMECDEPIEVQPGTPPSSQGHGLETEASLEQEKTAVDDTPHPVVHVEVRLTRGSTASHHTVCAAVKSFLLSRPGSCNLPAHFEPVELPPNAPEMTFFRENVAAVSLSTEDNDCPVSSLESPGSQTSVQLGRATLVVHVYRFVAGDEADPTQETLEVGGSGSSEVIRGGTRWALPSAFFVGLWDSLVYDSCVKRDLLKYSESALLFADCEVSHHVISWNRVIFLYGPPGTGKTSLCRALAHKLAIRLSHRFTSTALIEINTVNLMSKWFSESARLVSQMFSSIFEYLEDADHLVCLLVDEVESLTSVRKSVASSCEPSDALRVVNAVLTHLDQLKHYPNVLVMATSNVTGVVDPAFLDRADIRAYIGPPSPVAIYSIYSSCLNELIRVGLIERQKSGFLSYRVLAALQFAESPVTAASLKVWRLAQLSVGLNGRTLRKLPLLAHAFHMDPRYNQSSLFLRGVEKENAAPRPPPADASSTSPSSSSTSGKQRRRSTGSSVPLSVFVAALERAVEARFSDQRLIKASADQSNAGARVTGGGDDAPVATSLVDVNLP